MHFARIRGRVCEQIDRVGMVSAEAEMVSEFGLFSISKVGASSASFSTTSLVSTLNDEHIPKK